MIVLKDVKKGLGPDKIAWKNQSQPYKYKQFKGASLSLNNHQLIKSLKILIVKYPRNNNRFRKGRTSTSLNRDQSQPQS